MIRTIKIQQFLMLTDIVLVDVRTPAEYEQGHIPGAHNLPLFSNEERVLVGTTYKQVGRQEAILLGFDLVGSKWSGFIKRALEIAPEQKIAVHCWRGGMRSGAMAWALDLYGFEVYLIEGGYKRYRQWALDLFGTKFKLTLLGGMTGAGKTKILAELKKMGEQVIDLEDLAQHQGSSYGTMNKMVQPTQEQFENNLAYQLNAVDSTREVWVEDENRNIGKLSVPTPFWETMTGAALIDIQVDLEQRIKALSAEYGKLDADFLITCTDRIHKRLGPVQTKQAILAINENRMDDFVRLVLVYYDKTYRKSIARRDPEKVFAIEITGSNAAEHASSILAFFSSI